MTIYTGSIGELIDNMKAYVFFYKSNYIPSDIRKFLSIEYDIEFGTDSYCVSLVYENNDVRKILRTIKIGRFDLINETNENMRNTIIDMLELLLTAVFPKDKRLEEHRKLLEDK